MGHNGLIAVVPGVALTREVGDVYATGYCIGIDGGKVLLAGLVNRRGGKAGTVVIAEGYLNVRISAHLHGAAVHRDRWLDTVGPNDVKAVHAVIQRQHGILGDGIDAAVVGAEEAPES